MYMEQIFLMNEADRAAFLQNMIHSFGSTYICLWSYFPQPPNYLYCMDGLYYDENNQGSNSASSSSGSPAMVIFDDYQKSIFMTENSNGVPGFAFMSNLPYIELKESDLSKLASSRSQLEFYKEARIKTAIFMGCKTGEIELGMSKGSQVNLERKIKNMFPNDFMTQQTPTFPQVADHHNLASSSSSSLRSIDNSPDQYSPFLSNTILNPNTTTTILSPNYIQPAIIGPVEQALSQIQSTQLIPTKENEDAVMIQAILAVISSSTDASPSSSSSQQPQTHTRFSSAFKSYRSSLAPIPQISRLQSRQNLIKKSIMFFGNLRQTRGQQQLIQMTRPNTNLLHHMISERRRREKLNESFHVLRSLLPPGSKRAKASVLADTTEYITKLKAQVEELTKENQALLESQSQLKQALNQEEGTSSGFSSEVERVSVRITDVGGSTSESRMVNMEVNVRGESVILDLAIRVLEFLKETGDVSVVSLEAEMRTIGDFPVNRVVFRLKIQATEWDQSGLLEAVRRLVDDLAK